MVLDLLDRFDDNIPSMLQSHRRSAPQILMLPKRISQIGPRTNSAEPLTTFIQSHFLDVVGDCRLHEAAKRFARSRSVANCRR
jgi:hypothetical protein